jgi:group I intron endonuclease
MDTQLVMPITAPLPKSWDSPGVYAIYLENSPRAYVGSSVCARGRVLQHLAMLRKGIHHSRFLQRAWNEHGSTNFTVTLLEPVSVKSQLIERKQEWIDRLAAFTVGFNARPIAEANYGMSWTAEQNAQRSLNNRKTWSNTALRKKLSERFKGLRRGVWSAESHQKASASLRAVHLARPDWRATLRNGSRQSWKDPAMRERRMAGIARSLQDPDIYDTRVRQLRVASASPKRLERLLDSSFNRYGWPGRGFANNDEVNRFIGDLYKQGQGLRSIGRVLKLDHKQVAARLRGSGVAIESRYLFGSAVKSSKLCEADVRRIRQLLGEGNKHTALAAMFGVSQSVISEIGTRSAWRHVN